jgi:hypothetical protein
MAASSEVTVEGIVFPPVARPPGSALTHFLAGGGALAFFYTVYYVLLRE